MTLPIEQLSIDSHIAQYFTRYRHDNNIFRLLAKEEDGEYCLSLYQHILTNKCYTIVIHYSEYKITGVSVWRERKKAVMSKRNHWDGLVWTDNSAKFLENIVDE